MDTYPHDSGRADPGAKGYVSMPDDHTGTPSRAAELRKIGGALRGLSLGLDMTVAEDLHLAMIGARPFPNPFPPLPYMEREARALLKRAIELGAFREPADLPLRVYLESEHPLRSGFSWLAMNRAGVLADAQKPLADAANREHWESGGKLPLRRDCEIPELVARQALADVIEAEAARIEAGATAGTPGRASDETGDAAKPADPIPLVWLRTVVPQQRVKGDASKLAKWLGRQRPGIKIRKIAGKLCAERADLLFIFRSGSNIHGLIERHGRGD